MTKPTTTTKPDDRPPPQEPRTVGYKTTPDDRAVLRELRELTGLRQIGDLLRLGTRVLLAQEKQRHRATASAPPEGA